MTSTATLLTPKAVADAADDVEAMLARYLDEEREIYKITDPRTIQFAGSRSFNSNGFPVACLTRNNLGYYLDSQQENRALWYMHAIGNIDEATAEIAKDALRILKKANSETNGAGGGVSALVHGLYCALNIRKTLPAPRKDRPVHTLEIGPGSGWTTYFLTRFGFHTTTIDSNPNLIATQYYLMKQLPPDCAGRYTQLPWWKFYDINYHVPHAFDMVLANHMICEISQWSRLYIAKWASLHLTENGVMFFQAWGNEDFHSRYETVQDFKSHQIGPFARNDRKYPEITLLKRMAIAAPSGAFLARMQRKLVRTFPALRRLEYQQEFPLSPFENYQLNQGIFVEQLVREQGFNEDSFTNPSFLWCKVCH